MTRFTRNIIRGQNGCFQEQFSGEISTWSLRHVLTARDLTQSYRIVAGVSRWPMAGPSMKDHKSAQGASQYTISDAQSSTRTMIGGLAFWDNCHMLHSSLFYNYYIILILFIKNMLFIN